VTVRAVVFDVGKVLVEWGPRYLYEKLIPDDSARAAFLRDVVTTDWHFQHDAGRPFAETSAELITAFPEHRTLIEAWGERFLETIPHHVDGMVDLVGELAARAVPLFAITNFSGEFWRPFVAREAALFAPFRDIIVSGDERLMKPDPAIFRLARSRFGLDDGEGMFVDDLIDNVRASEREGFIGHHFRDAATLRGALVAHGLLD
jgi:2-haloacid dehalogenase